MFTQLLYKLLFTDFGIHDLGPRNSAFCKLPSLFTSKTDLDYADRNDQFDQNFRLKHMPRFICGNKICFQNHTMLCMWLIAAVSRIFYHQCVYSAEYSLLRLFSRNCAVQYYNRYNKLA